jgi:hypothetical protein
MTARWMATAGVLAGAAMLAGCGGAGKGNSQTQNNVNALQSAANQSSPAAREVLQNEAANLSGQNVTLPPNDPRSPTQQAMNKAGQVEANQTGTPAAGQMDATPAPAR